MHAESVPLERLAREAGTPLYVYSANALRERYRAIANAFADFEPLVCYSVKSNGNLAVLSLLAAEGAGFDIVSGGELFRVLRAGGDAGRTVFAGVGKKEEEMAQALAAGVHSINVESEIELERLDRVAREGGRGARAAIRVNPGVSPSTHAYVATGHAASKFGVSLDRARDILQRARRWKGVEIVGLHAHIGSQILEVAPYVEALDRLATLLDAMPGRRLPWVDLGGGFGIDYGGGPGLDPEVLAAALREKLRTLRCGLVLEPGRWVSGPAGILLTRVIDVKRGGSRAFVVADAGMNDLLRPALYGAQHRIVPVLEREGEALRADIVGPVCETGDFLGLDRELGEYVIVHELLHFSVPNHGKLWKSLMKAYLGDHEILHKRLQKAATRQS